MKTSQAQKFLTYTGPKIWNKLPLHLKHLTCFKFKKELKKKMLSCYTN